MTAVWRRWAAPGLAALLLSLVCAVASAGPAREEANALYRRGNRQFTRGDHRGALQSYRKARVLFSSYKLDFNIARCLDSLGQTTEAATFFQRFLHRVDRDAPTEMVSQAKTRLRQLRRRLASVTLSHLAGTVVMVNGKSLGTPPPGHRLYLTPGTHYISARRAGLQPLLLRISLVAGEHRPLKLALRTSSRSRDTAVQGHGSTPEPDTKASSSSSLQLAGTHRLVLSLGFGLGVADLERVHALADDIQFAVEATHPHTIKGTPQSSLALNLELSVRYLSPYHLLGQLGLGLLYNSASSTFAGPALESLGMATSGTVVNRNMALELPLLVGGYLVLWDRLYLCAAVGPALFFSARSYWDAEPGAMADLGSDVGLGFHALLGADWMLTSHVGLGLELRYRYLRTSDLQLLESGDTLESGALLGDGSGDAYDLDFSGLMVAFNLRFAVL